MVTNHQKTVTKDDAQENEKKIKKTQRKKEKKGGMKSFSLKVCRRPKIGS